MQREIKKYLFDIQGCIEKIENFIGKPQIFASFEQNIMLQQAVERNLEIIGEAIIIYLKFIPKSRLQIPEEWWIHATK